MELKPFLIKFVTSKNDNNDYRDIVICDDFHPRTVSSEKSNLETKITEVDGETTDDE